MFVLVVLLATSICHILAAPSSNYIQTGECQREQTCVYEYSVEQQYFGQEGQQNVTVSSTVEITCHSVGEYNGTSSTLYCMTLTDTEVEGNIFNKSTSEDRKYHKKIVRNLLSGWFCFVQMEDGKVAAVQHATNESDDATNFKKAIAAAFQANFKGTSNEEETDTQSYHIAHYRYEQTPDGIKKMYRRIEGDDVISYSTGAPKKDLKLIQNDDIEYRNGTLYHSDGYTEVRIKDSRRKESEDEDQPSFSDILSARGSYTLDLQHCYSVPQRQRARQRRNVQTSIDEDMQQEDLSATFNKTKEEKVELKLIRERIASITEVLNELNSNPEQRQLLFELRRLLELENEYGPLPQFTPAVQEILNYLENIQHFQEPQALSMRKLIYSLLSAEGSLQAQMALFEALQSVTSVQEKDTVITFISMIDNAHIELVYALEQQILMEADGRDVVLLTIGILASTAQSDVAHEIETFLLSLLENAVSAEEHDSSHLIDIILALGNTGSEEVATTLLEYINDPLQEVQVASIRALLKLTHLQVVRDSLMEVLASNPQEEIVIMVVHTMVKGYHHSKDLGIDTTSLADHPVLATMVSTVLRFNNTALVSLVVNFLSNVGGEQALGLITELHSREKRQTTDWDTYSSQYNLVASLSRRQSDVNNYPSHIAYLWRKDFGNSDARLRAAAGVFVGRSTNYENLKGYAKVYADGSILDGGTKTLVDAEILLQKTGSSIRGRVYVQIGSNVHTNYDRSTQCYNYNSDIYQGRYRLYSFRYRIYLYVTTLGVDINVNLELDVDFSSQICASGSLTQARGSATGIANLDARVDLTADGSIHATLLGVARSGITAEVSLEYRPEMRAKAKVCAAISSVNYHSCVDASDRWPSNRLRISAWYQTRSVSTRWCGSWIRYPCGIRVRWGSRHDVLSSSWSLGSRGRQTIYGPSCRGQSSSTCSAYL